MQAFALGHRPPVACVARWSLRTYSEKGWKLSGGIFAY